MWEGGWCQGVCTERERTLFAGWSLFCVLCVSYRAILVRWKCVFPLFSLLIHPFLCCFLSFLHQCSSSCPSHALLMFSREPKCCDAQLMMSRWFRAMSAVYFPLERRRPARFHVGKLTTVLLLCSSVAHPRTHWSGSRSPWQIIVDSGDTFSQ